MSSSGLAHSDVLLHNLFVLQAATVNFVTGSLVWVEDPEEAWIDGEIVEVNGEDIKINCTTGKTVSAFLSCCVKVLVTFCTMA